jgi:myxalamid-type nonribosomal peptide synthetase MxaA
VTLEFRGRVPGDGYGGDILMTGAGSLLGGYLLAELLGRCERNVHALVPAGDFASGYDLLRHELRSRGRWNPSYADRVRPVPADLARPWLGMAPASFADLAERLDAIFHCAADDHLVKSYEELAPVNVHGTDELLKLAAYGRGVRFHHISITTVAPVDPAANRCVEAWPDGRRAVCGTPDVLEQAPGFVRARWVAEHLVADASHRNLAASIYRTRTLTGDSDGRYPVRDVLVEYIQSTLRSGICPPGRIVYWTPADYAAQAITLLAAQTPDVYHIPACPVPLAWAWEHLRRQGYPLRDGTDDEWRSAIKAADASFAFLLDDDPGPSAQEPEADCSRALAVIGGLLGPPVVTTDLVGRYLDDMRARGML